MMTLASVSVDSRRSLAIRVAPADRAASNMAAPGTTARPMTCEHREPVDAGAQSQVLHACGLADRKQIPPKPQANPSVQRVLRPTGRDWISMIAADHCCLYAFHCRLTLVLTGSASCCVNKPSTAARLRHVGDQ